ncbi:MAG: bifunctional DNA-formamidopyrimidine glycosylase/DNA-(apurinic or apyrimidinic site) lyase, partial [Patescibacteria group bacterium]|nr:bifunctional DNA-formamidopyrimidine glycosylase/DNA-(apurinic or apyrimidinic site) lyase [Patescibacteria group bacterium]
MPELPEVETIRRDAQKTLIGLKILGAQILDHKPVLGQDKEIENLKAVIKAVRRRGKILIIDLDQNRSLIIHLKMTGQFVFQSQKSKVKGQNLKAKVKSKIPELAGGHFEIGSLEVPNKFTRLIFNLNHGKLYFNDLRKFGWVRLVATNKIENLKEIKNLGVEPLTPQFSLKVFKEIIKRRPKKPVKMLLLDQALISGIGNIYSSEALFWAKINPIRLAGSLNQKEIKALHKAINKVLKEGIATGGSSENTYVDLFGEKGAYLKKEVVYRREGNRCPRHCGGIVKRIKQGGRSSFFCSQCQK